MLDIKFVRENPDLVDKACESRQNAHWDREKFFELDEERRSVIAEVESLQAERNAVSKQIGLLMREGKKEEAEAAKEQVAANKDRIAELDQRRGEVEEELTDLVAAIPNIPDASVPYGKMTPITQRFVNGERQLSLTLSQRRTGILDLSWA